MFAIVGDLGKLILLVILSFACIGGCLLAFTTVGEDKIKAELAEANAELAEAEAEAAREKANLERAEGEREKANAEAEALRMTTRELVRHSRLNRRLLSWYAVTRGWQGTLFAVLGVSNLVVWGVVLYLWRR